MRKQSAKWVPRLLTIDHKRKRQFKSDVVKPPSGWVFELFCYRGWKQQPKHWISTRKSWPKKAEIGLPANKAKVTIFSGGTSNIYNHFLQQGRISNGEFHDSSLDWCNDDLKKNRPHLAKMKVAFHKDVARVYRWYKVLHNPLYSLDLASSDFIQTWKNRSTKEMKSSEHLLWIPRQIY